MAGYRYRICHLHRQFSICRDKSVVAAGVLGPAEPASETVLGYSSNDFPIPNIIVSAEATSLAAHVAIERSETGEKYRGGAGSSCDLGSAFKLKSRVDGSTTRADIIAVALPITQMILRRDPVESDAAVNKKIGMTKFKLAVCELAGKGGSWGGLRESLQNTK